MKDITKVKKKATEYILKIHKMYEQANRNIQREIESVYQNYSKDTGVDVQKLKELLTKSETKRHFEELKKLGLNKYVKDNYKSRINRLERLQLELYKKIKDISSKEQRKHTELYQDTIKNGYYKAIYDTQIGTGYDFNFSEIDNNMIKSLMSERWQGSNYSERIWKNTDVLASQVSDIVGGALLSGQSIEKTARQIRERFGVAKYYASRLARTEMNYFNNQADAMAYEEMGIDKYVYVAILDSRTSEICQSLDNKVFNYKDMEIGVNYPPMHPNCRSTTRGYLGEEAEKLLKRKAKNPITGEYEIIGNISYKDWYNQNVSQYGQDKMDIAIKKAINQVKDREQYDRYINKLSKKNIGSFDNFREIKYNNSNQWGDYKHTYRLKTHYDKVINKGELSALVDFNLYEHFDKTISAELNGVNTVKDITVKGYSLHFIDRVFGSVEQKRSGVNVEDIKATLQTATKYKEKDKSIKIYGEKTIVSINPKTGRLIQVNPC